MKKEDGMTIEALSKSERRHLAGLCQRDERDQRLYMHRAGVHPRKAANAAIQRSESVRIREKLL
jgi:hypothetical protein